MEIKFIMLLLPIPEVIRTDNVARDYKIQSWYETGDKLPDCDKFCKEKRHNDPATVTLKVGQSCFCKETAYGIWINTIIL